MALTEANCFRGAEVTRTYLDFYSARLVQEDSYYLFKALTILGERDREEGEPFLLNMPMILKQIRDLTPRKKTLVEIQEDVMAEERRKAIREIESE
jgi:hypothetical protein